MDGKHLNSDLELKLELLHLSHRIYSLRTRWRKQFERKTVHPSFPFLEEKTAAAKWKLDARLISSVKSRKQYFFRGKRHPA
jgi:hypothetical protein